MKIDGKVESSTLKVKKYKSSADQLKETFELRSFEYIFSLSYICLVEIKVINIQAHSHIDTEISPLLAESERHVARYNRQ